MEGEVRPGGDPFSGMQPHYMNLKLHTFISASDLRIMKSETAALDRLLELIRQPVYLPVLFPLEFRVISGLFVRLRWPG